MSLSKRLYTKSYLLFLRKKRSKDKKIRKSKYSNVLTKEFLEREYLINKKSTNKLAEELDLNCSVIWNTLKRYNIPIRKESWNKGKTGVQKCSNDTRKKMSLSGKKRWLNNLEDRKKYGLMLSKINKGIPKSKETKEKIRQKALERFKNPKNHPMYGKKQLLESILNRITKVKEKWNNIDFRNIMIPKIIKGLKLKPNKPETVLINLLNSILPNEYKYVGDGYTFIAGYNPDFINVNSQKKIIEMFGDYWHNRKKTKIRDIKRLKTYKKYGYDTLVIWEHELKDLDKVKNRILKFNDKKVKI